ncbi:MAG: DUF2147 domain-containing protein [Opitutales bacterium]
MTRRFLTKYRVFSTQVLIATVKWLLRFFATALLGLLYPTSLVLGNTGEGVYWMLVDGDGKLEAQVADGELRVRVIAIEPESQGLLDEKNPDETLRDRRVLGLVVMWGFHWDEGDRRWEGGTVYDPTTGESYDAFIWSDNGKLKVRGYRLVGWFGRTETFEPVEGPAPKQKQPEEPELVYLDR